MDTNELAKACQKHAEAHYNDGGWDVIVECWSLDEIAAFNSEHNVTTVEGFVKAISGVVDVWSERQADARYHERQAVGVRLSDSETKALEDVKSAGFIEVGTGHRWAWPYDSLVEKGLLKIGTKNFCGQNRRVYKVA
jgi:hypothetical protein